MSRFLVAFGVVTLLIAGLLSYLADPDPDGLDAVTRRGCAVDAAQELAGDCIARDAREHALADGPLADYAVGGDGALTGLAGIAGVLVTLALTGGLFWLLRRRTPTGRVRRLARPCPSFRKPGGLRRRTDRATPTGAGPGLSPRDGP
jgi:cobalt/nickel transport protein